MVSADAIPAADRERLLAAIARELGIPAELMTYIEDLPDKLVWVKFSGIAWTPDGKGFYYTRYPAPGSVPKEEETYHRRVFLHRLGADPETDEEVFRPVVES